MSSLHQPITHGVPQWSVLGPLLFLIYINHLNHVVKHSTVRHFADGTNLIYSISSLKSINKYIYHGLKLIVHWLRGNRISLNVNKTKIILFRPKKEDNLQKYEFLHQQSKNNFDNSYQIFRGSPGSILILGTTSINAKAKTQQS